MADVLDQQHCQSHDSSETKALNNLEILQLLVDLAEKESDRYLVSYSMMLYSSTGLIAVLTITLENGFSPINLVPSILGIVIAISWLRINFM
jgi:hypothetical protein